MLITPNHDALFSGSTCRTVSSQRNLGRPAIRPHRTTVARRVTLGLMPALRPPGPERRAVRDPRRSRPGRFLWIKLNFGSSTTAWYSILLPMNGGPYARSSRTFPYGVGLLEARWPHRPPERPLRRYLVSVANLRFVGESHGIFTHKPALVVPEVVEVEESRSSRAVRTYQIKRYPEEG